jgi:hypothetical protein
MYEILENWVGSMMMMDRDNFTTIMHMTALGGDKNTRNRI